jgi:hypothetical protein
MPLFTPIGGGGIGKATISATTGSPTVDTTSRPGKTIYKFLSGTGSITVDTPGTAEILVVGGGGGGGGAGGAGAGGVLYESAGYLTAGTHNIRVGVGGQGYFNGAYGDNATNGTGSYLGSFYALGGGAGANNYYSRRGNNGASGGGGYYEGYQGGTGTPGQGNDGAAGTGAPNYYFGGGGGAGGVGGPSSDKSIGGVGRQLSITGTATYYGGGGAGSGNGARTGGLGGGGNGANTNGFSGTANTGGGGGAGDTSGGSGGSGVVIVVIG